MIKNGDIVTFQIRNINRGYSNALNCVVEITIPDGIEYSSSVCSKGSYVALENKWNIGGLEPSEEVTMDFSVLIVDDSKLPAQILWEATTTVSEISLSNNQGNYLITNSCYALRYCLEFLKYKHVWVDYQNAKISEAQLGNILKPYATIEDAIEAISLLEEDNEGWEFHISGETEEVLTFENILGETSLDFNNFKTSNTLHFNEIGEKLILKGQISKYGSGQVFEFGPTVNLEAITLDMIILRDTSDTIAVQEVEALGSIWIKSCIAETDEEDFGVPTTGNDVILKPIA